MRLISLLMAIAPCAMSSTIASSQAAMPVQTHETLVIGYYFIGSGDKDWQRFEGLVETEDPRRALVGGLLFMRTYAQYERGVRRLAETFSKKVPRLIHTESRADPRGSLATQTIQSGRSEWIGAYKIK